MSETVRPRLIMPGNDEDGLRCSRGGKMGEHEAAVKQATPVTRRAVRFRQDSKTAKSKLDIASREGVRKVFNRMVRGRTRTVAHPPKQTDEDAAGLRGASGKE